MNWRAGVGENSAEGLNKAFQQGGEMGRCRLRWDVSESKKSRGSLRAPVTHQVGPAQAIRRTLAFTLSKVGEP